MSELFFARGKWLPRVFCDGGEFRLEIVGGANGLGDARIFTVPLSEEHAARILDDVPRHVLLRAALLPLCYAAGSMRSIDESAAVGLLDPILFGAEDEIDALFDSIAWDRRGIIAYGASAGLLDEGRTFAAVQSATTASSWDRVRQYEAEHTDER